MELLFTVDSNYAIRIPVVLYSIRIYDPGVKCKVNIIIDDISQDIVDDLTLFCSSIGYSIEFFKVPGTLFEKAPINKHYSKAMYYRLLAGDILPADIKRVLYLDPDILVINSLLPLWEMDLEGCCFAAASHNEDAGLANNINRVRLETSAAYYNTGILLIDLEQSRKCVKNEDIFSYIKNNDYKLLLPDQDVFNALYSDKVRQIPDEIWNYDARKYTQYMLKSGGVMDDRWVIRNTAILHFCGKGKPWNEHYRYRYGNLYRHYENLTDKLTESIKLIRCKED